MELLQYRTVVYSMGFQFHCVETYESIFESLRSAKFKSSDKDEMTWLQPIEVSARGEEDHPMRVAIAPASISAIVEIPVDQRVDVAE